MISKTEQPREVTNELTKTPTKAHFSLNSIPSFFSIHKSMKTDNSNPEKLAQVTAQPSPPPPATDVENQTGAAGGVSNVMPRWNRAELVKRGSFVLRGLGLIFSVLAFVIMASNEHGDWREFHRYEEYRYVLAIAILSTLYTGLQVFRHVGEVRTGREMFPMRNVAVVDFFGDQIVAYLLLSAASSAVPLTNNMRAGADNIFTDSSAAAISMEFFAFFALALSAIVSGYKLSNQTYI